MSKIRISCETEGADIYYTLDGSTPDNSKNLYTSEFDVNEACTIKAIAEKEGYDNSETSSKSLNKIIVNDNPLNSILFNTLYAFYFEDIERYCLQARIETGQLNKIIPNINEYTDFTIKSKFYFLMESLKYDEQYISDLWNDMYNSELNRIEYNYQINPSNIDKNLDIYLEIPLEGFTSYEDFQTKINRYNLGIVYQYQSKDVISSNIFSNNYREGSFGPQLYSSYQEYKEMYESYYTFIQPLS